MQLLVGALFAWVATGVIAAILGAANPLPRPITRRRQTRSGSRSTGRCSRPIRRCSTSGSNGSATTRSGERFDVARGAAAEPDKPERLSAQESWSWRIWLGYLQGLELDDPVRALILERLAEFSCRDWNAARPEAERFESIEIVQVMERTLPVGTAPLNASRRVAQLLARRAIRTRSVR